MFQLNTGRKKALWFLAAFAVGVGVTLIPCLVVIVGRYNIPATTSTTVTATHSEATTTATTATTSTSDSTTITQTAWNPNDYQSNSDYYNSLLGMHNFDQADNLRLDRISSPQFHPIHGRTAIYLRRQYHMPDLRASTTTLHWLDLETDKVIQLTRPIWGKHDQQIFWIDNRTVLFLSNRASSELTQIFQLILPETITEKIGFIDPVQITDFPLDIDNLLVNRQASRLAFSCQVFANLTMEQTVQRLNDEKASGRKIYQFNKLFIRHWDEFMTGQRHHPFVASIERQSNGIFHLSSNPVDVLFDKDSDSPTRPFGDALAQWSFSASGDSFAYTRQYDETSEVAWTTNLDIFTVDLRQSRLTSVCITEDNKATDTDPLYSTTDENVLVYRSHSIPGYEADQYKIKLFNGSRTPITLLDDQDLSIQRVTWSIDGQSLFLEIGLQAENVVYYLENVLSTNSTLRLLIADGTSRSINPHPTDKTKFLLTYETMTQPTNIYMYSSSGLDRPLTNHNSVLLRKVKMSPFYEKFSFTGARGDTVWGWHMPPVTGIATRAPLAFLIHGGPQSSWYNTWSYRLSLQLFASQGFAVIAIDFHGSVSYGQNFTDSIIGEYGSLPYEDLKLGLDYALNNFLYIDPNRTAALGTSYGGYMVNWIAGQPEMSRRFKTFVSQNAVFDVRSKAYSTDELWFTEYDAGNFTPWGNPEAYERYNPVNHVANWTQPMLIIVGARDYRVPETQGISTFTALQRRGIESRLLYFPTENHWVINPLHSISWYDEMLTWLRKYTP